MTFYKILIALGIMNGRKTKNKTRRIISKKEREFNTSMTLKFWRK